MSLNALTDIELRRATSGAHKGQDQFDSSGPVAVAVPLEAAKPNPVSNALNALVGYIPTEVITLYVAALSAVTAVPPPLTARGESRIRDLA